MEIYLPFKNQLLKFRQTENLKKKVGKTRNTKGLALVLLELASYILQGILVRNG